MVRLGTVLVVAVLAVILSGCTSHRRTDAEAARLPTDIHGELLEKIGRDGFAYGAIRHRDDGRRVDVISINLSLDSLKGRDLSLDQLATDIGRICTRPDYAHLPIFIRIRAGDEDDQMYLFAILAAAVKDAGNIDLTAGAGLRNEILITIHHSIEGD